MGKKLNYIIIIRSFFEILEGDKWAYKCNDN